MPTLDEPLLHSFAKSFFGYGNWRAPFWFVGMEEGGVQSLDELARRTRAWADDGRPELVDLIRFHERIDAGHWFAPNPPLQPTWRPLIRAVHVAQGIATPSLEMLRTYQERGLGRTEGDTTLLELLPFPSKKASDWLYGSIPSYSTRAIYERTLMPLRTQQLLERIDEHQPIAVVFYGNAAYWRSHLSMRAVAPAIHTGHRGATQLIATNHPAAPGTTNARWDEIGRLMGAARSRSISA